MIINGGSRSNRKWFAKHLTNGEKNERVSLCEVRGLTGESIGDAFLEMEAVASGTRCKNYFYHANINPRDDERLTPEQWEAAVDRLEHNLGLADHARFVVEHDKNGRVHRHVVWSRIDVEKMRAVKMTNDYAQHQATARELEVEFGLEKGASTLAPDREEERPERRPKQWEVFRGKGSGIDPLAVREEVTDLWNRTDSGKAFKAALEEQGYILTRGDRRDFCVIDQAGHEHSLARRVMGAKAKDIRERMGDVDRLALPSVAEGKEIAVERRRVMEEQNPEERKRQEIGKQEAQNLEAIGKQDQQKLEAIGKEEEQKKQTTAEEQSRREQYRKDEAQKQARTQELTDQQLQQQLNGQLEQLQVMQQRRALEDAYLSQRAREAEEGKRARQLEGDVTQPHGRYAQALGQHYDVRDPYGSLSRAAMAEHATFMRERQSLDRQLAQEKDPEARKALELRKQIEGAEYMAITDRRIAGQSEVITGKRNSPEALKSRERATAFEQEAKQLREQYREHQLARERGGVSPQAGVEKGQDGKQAQVNGTPSSAKASEGAPAQAEKEKAQAAKTQTEKAPVGVAKEATAEKPAPPLMVVDKKNGNRQVPLTAFVKDLSERQSAQDADQQRRERQRGEQALNEIGAAMKSGKPLNADDVRNLPRRDVEQIKQQGDAPLRARVQQREQVKEQARSHPHAQAKEQER